MELNDLKTRWRETEQRMEDMQAELRAVRRAADAAERGRVRWKMGLVRAVLWGELAFGVLAALLVGSYLPESFVAPRFAIPGILLHLGAIGLIASAARQLWLLSTVDFAGSVVDTQRRLARLRRMRSRVNRWLIVSAPALWALLVIAVPHALIGLDVYAAFGVPWVAANLGFGAVVVAAVAWVARRFPTAYRQSRFIRALGDDLTGRRITSVTGFLAELDAFEEG